MTVDEHHFLLLVSEKALTWPEADAKAVALGVNWALASLDSRPEAEEVYQMFANVTNILFFCTALPFR